MLALGLGLLAAGGCTAGTPDGDAVPPPEFGLGGKADGDLCDPAADLCWPTDQQAAIRTVLTGQDRLLLGVGDARANAQLMVAGLQRLTIKLTDEELAAVDALAVTAGSLSPDADESQRQTFLGIAQDGPTGRLIAHYVSALSVPVGSAAEAESVGKADSFGEEQDPGIRTDLTDGMRESLALLRDAGVAGKLYALMFEQLGNLDDLPSLFDEAFPFSEPREDRVQRIINYYQLASAGASLVAGVEGLIPVAGIVISFSHKTIMDFRIRARLTLEIAMLYGVDVREGQNLFFVASTMMDLFSATDARTVIASNFGIRLLAAAAFKYGLGTSLNAVVRTLATRGVANLLLRMGEKGAELAASAIARTAGTQTMHQVLGYLTLGLTVVVDAASSAYLTTRTAEDAHAAFRPWGVGMTTFRAPYLATAADRTCAALALGDIITADATATESERLLLAAHLGRASWVAGDWEWFLGEAQLHALEAAGVGLPGTSANQQARQDVVTCLVDRWRELGAEDRLAALSDLYAMAAVDGELNPAELERYALYESLLIDGVGLTNFDLKPEHLDLMKHIITVLLATPADALPPDQLELVADLPVTARLEFLDQVPTDLQSSVTCAYESSCP